MSRVANTSLRDRRQLAYENPRPDVQALIPRTARRILDLGCSSGALGAAIKERQGAHVTGVEVDPVYAEAARARLDEVFIADLDALFADAVEPAAMGDFDCLVAADVLEHTRDPWTILRRATAQLTRRPSTVVVSLPNVRYWETFFQLGVKGRWPRRDVGIFDATHVRWFTQLDALDLLAQAGVETTQLSPQYRLRPQQWWTGPQGSRFRHTPLRDFFVFQYVLAGSLD